ncbi:MAG: hypothetical protein GYA86_10770, partial [Firmicutes bacterium]|nr:hypothetical protein [Bacillota bacterium]
GSPGGEDQAAAGTIPEKDDPALLKKLVDGRRLWFDELSGAVRSAAVPGPYISAGGLAGLAGEIAAGSTAASLDGEPAAVVPGGGIAFGSAFHDIMEQVELENPAPGRLAGLADRTAGHWGIGDSGELIRLVRATLEHPLIARARQARLLLRELPFIYELDDLLVEGIIDLLFQEGEGLVIVDYKTDLVTPDELERRWAGYRRQGMVYALAMAGITGLPVREISFLFVREGLVKSLLNPDLAALREALRKT